MSVSSIVSGGSAELKQRWKNEFRSSAFLLSSVMVSSLHDNVGIRDELFPLIALIAAQNCLGFLALATLLTQDFLALRNSALFLSYLYFNLDCASPNLLYLLYA